MVRPAPLALSYLKFGENVLSKDSSLAFVSLTPKMVALLCSFYCIFTVLESLRTISVGERHLLLSLSKNISILLRYFVLFKGVA